MRFRFPTTLVLLLAALAAAPAVTTAQTLDVETHLEMAREGLQFGEYLAAATNYRKAAQLGDSVEIAQQATRLAASLGFDDEALLAAERWRELDRDNEQALMFLAQLQLRDGQYRAARRNFRQLLKLDGVEPDERLLALAQLLADEDPATTYELISDLARPYRNSASANYAVAVAAIAADRPDEALQRAEQAAELDPDWLKAKLLYGRAMLFAGDEDGAIDYTARLVGDTLDPDPDSRMELALLYLTVGRDDDALSQVNQILLEDPARADALRLSGIINFRQDKLDAAWQDFESLLATRRFTNDALFYLARIADIRDEFDRAIRLYAGVQTGSNAVPAQRRASALLAFEKDNEAQALELLDAFASASPANAVDMTLAKADLLAALEQGDDALIYYDRYVEFRPGEEGAMLGRAQLLLRMGRLEEALAQYREAVELHPESATSLNALGYTLADRTGDYDEAEALIRRAMEKEPDNPAIIDSMGWVLFRQGQPEAALEQLERAYASFDDPEVAAHIVEVLHSLGRTDESLQRLREAEEKDPDNALLDDVRQRLFPDAD